MGTGFGQNTEYEIPVSNQELSSSAVQCRKKFFYEQRNVVQVRRLKGDIPVVVADLNARLGSNNILLGCVMGIHGVGDRNDNGEKFVNFFSLHHLVIGRALFESLIDREHVAR